MTNDYASYNALALQPGVERLACMAHVRCRVDYAQKVQPKSKTGRPDTALTMINKLYGIEREHKDTVMKNALTVVRKRAYVYWPS